MSSKERRIYASIRQEMAIKEPKAPKLSIIMIIMCLLLGACAHHPKAHKQDWYYTK